MEFPPFLGAKNVSFREGNGKVISVRASPPLRQKTPKCPGISTNDIENHTNLNGTLTTFPETKSSHLIMDGWKITKTYFRVLLLVSGSVAKTENWELGY